MAKDSREGVDRRRAGPDSPLGCGTPPRSCHVALGCRHYSLFDFRIDPAGRPWFLEAGLYCSFARQSVIPMMAAAAGISLPDLFQTALAQTVRPTVAAG